MDAPGRRGRFATKSAKSNDDACAVGTFHCIVSSYCHMKRGASEFRKLFEIDC